MLFSSNWRLPAACLVWLTLFTAADPSRLAAQPSNPPDAASEAIVVPDGTPEELLAFIDGLRQRQPPAGDRAAMLAFAQKQYEAMIAAAEKLFAAKPTEPQAMEAAGAKLVALVGLKRLQVPGIEPRLARLPSELNQAGFPAVARRVRAVLLQIDLGTAMSRAQAGPLEQVVETIKAHLAQPPLQPEDVRLAVMALQAMEQLSTPQRTADACAAFAKTFSASPDPQIRKLGLLMEGAARRLTSLHKEIQLEGTFMDGQPLDWSSYRGKVVLVMFWASWCEPCKAEIANLRRLYNAYHSRGFDVLGINCDSDRSKAEQFVRQKKLPWRNLLEADPEKAGLDSANAVRYGVMALPVMLLLNKKGQVISLQARTATLQRELDLRLGPPEPTKLQAAPSADNESSTVR